MACNFSANQFEKEFASRKLCNWQTPKWHPSRPIQRTNVTKVISNDRGHLLPGISRPTTNPWGHFKGTWQLPDKISRNQAFDLSKPHIGGSRWAKPLIIKEKQEILEDNHNNTEKIKDLNYAPGDFTNPKDRHESRDTLTVNNPQLKEYEKYNGNNLYLEEHKCTDRVSLLNEQEKKRREYIPHVLNTLPTFDEAIITSEKMRRRKVTEKPGEKLSTPIVPAFFNFQTARKMAQENLEHQPLPDSIMNRAFRQLQAQGELNPGLALDVLPTATGVGVKSYKSGPTHCTKLKVYRPKTCGIVPRAIDKTKLHMRPHTSIGEKNKMGAMDLAICWDYHPKNPNDEPKPPTHIDGSNGSMAPAVFTLVRTPRSTMGNQQDPINTGRSGGLFSNTLGEDNFFDRGILRHNTEYGQYCTCGTSPPNWKNNTKNENIYKHQRSSSAEKKEQSQLQRPVSLKKTRCKSSPNLSQIENSNNNVITVTKENALKYYSHYPHGHHHQHRFDEMKPNNIKQCNNNNQSNKPKCEHHHQSINKSLKTPRLCEQNIELYKNEQKPEFKRAFKVGIPNSNSSGTCKSFDSACSMMTTTSSSSISSNVNKFYKIPKPRNPFIKKNYIIDTLAPPFSCWHGGAGQGGYPEHWRLASVYQHAYKPIEQRKRPLLATVYQ